MLPDHSVGEATYLARPPSSFPASNLGIVGANKPDTLFPSRIAVETKKLVTILPQYQLLSDAM